MSACAPCRWLRTHRRAPARPGVRVIASIAIVITTAGCRETLDERRVASAAASPAATARAVVALEAIADWVEAARVEQGVPGAVVVVMQGDEITLARGFGQESIERSDPVTAETVFPINSLSKQLVAALVLRLAEGNRLALGDPAARHLPEIDTLPPELTLRHLLEHSSGLRDVLVQPALAAMFDRLDATDDDFLAAARSVPLDHAPGSRWTYANLNYMLLALVAERAGGAPLEQQLRERFFDALALSTMRVCPQHPGLAPGTARGHRAGGDGTLEPHPPENFPLFRGAGGFCASPLDLARWTRALMTGRALAPDSLAAMTTPARLADGSRAEYGFAVVTSSPDGFRRLGHGGYGGGFSAQAAYYPERDTTLVVMFNRFVFPEHVERRIATYLHGLPERALAPVATTVEQRARYAGLYDVGIVGWYPEVVDRDGRLWLEVAPIGAQPLAYVGDDVFVREGEPYGYRLEFGPDRPGRRLELLGMGMMRWYGTRRTPPDG